MTVFVDQDVGLGEKHVRRQGGKWSSESYPLQIPMYHSLTMYINQPPDGVFELSEGVIRGSCDRQEQDLTSSNRFTSLCALANSLMFPFAIHTDTIAKSESPIVTPNSGSTFGWRRAFQVTTSLQNLYTGRHQLANTHFQRGWKPTVVTLSRLLVE